MAKQKILDAAVMEMIALYKKKHSHDFDSLAVLLGLPRNARNLQGDEEGFRARCMELYHEVEALGEGTVDAETILMWKAGREAICMDPALFHSLVEEHLNDDGHLTSEGFVEVMVHVLRENVLFLGDETFESLTRVQLQRLLANNWESNTVTTTPALTRTLSSSASFTNLQRAGSARASLLRSQSSSHLASTRQLVQRMEELSLTELQHKWQNLTRPDGNCMKWQHSSIIKEEYRPSRILPGTQNRLSEVLSEGIVRH